MKIGDNLDATALINYKEKQISNLININYFLQ